MGARDVLRWRRPLPEVRPQEPAGRPSTVERFLRDIYPRLAEPTPTLAEDASYHIGTFKEATGHYGLQLRRTGGRTYEILRGGQVIGRLDGMLTDLVNRNVVRLCADKARAVTVLREAGVPVPLQKRYRRGRVDQALEFARRRGFDVVVKPCVGAGGVGITTTIAGENDFRQAWAYAVEHLSPNWPPNIVVESKCPGMDIRAVVVGGRFSCAATRMPAHVTGDGRATLATLIERKNAARSAHPYHARYPIVIDGRLIQRLQARGLSLDTVVPAGDSVVLAEVNNVHAGGDACEITDFVPARIRTIAERAARAIPGLAVVGVDLLVTSLDDDAEIAVIEMNPRANFSIHFAPYRGQPRNPALDIVPLMLNAAPAVDGAAS